MKAWPRHSPPPPLPADDVGIPGSRGAGRSLRRRGVVDMATEGDVELELETETSGPERPPEKPRKHDSGAADLERVTDYAEEKEIQSSNLETVRRAGRVSVGLRAEGAPRGQLEAPLQDRVTIPMAGGGKRETEPSLGPAACEKELAGDWV